MKKLSYCVLLCAAALASACFIGCKNNNNKDTRPVLAVSIEPQRYLLDRLVGDKYRVITVMPNGDNPETFEPSPATRIDVENSDVYFTTGHLLFEANMELTSKEDVIFVNTSENIEPIYGTHDHESSHKRFLPDEDEEPDADPHVWSSVRNARSMVEVMANTLKKIDPSNADEYAERELELDMHLDSLDHEFATRLEKAGNPPFLIWHPSLSYFARDYSLRQVSVGHEGKEASVAQMREAIDKASNDSVKVFFYQPDLDSRQAKAISSGSGTRMVPVNMLEYDWEGSLRKVVDELTHS